MASVSLSFSSQFVGGTNFSVSPKTMPASSVRFRSSPSVSAAYATAERTRLHIASPASLYDVLGVQIGATCPEIKAAYRRLARVSHPDVASHGRDESSAEEFMRIHAAYTTLSDAEKRAEYDRTLARRRQPTSLKFSMSAGSAPVMSSVSRFSGKSCRTWETDQCW